MPAGYAVFHLQTYPTNNHEHTRASLYSYNRYLLLMWHYCDHCWYHVYYGYYNFIPKILDQTELNEVCIWHSLSHTNQHRRYAQVLQQPIQKVGIGQWQMIVQEHTQAKCGWQVTNSFFYSYWLSGWMLPLYVYIGLSVHTLYIWYSGWWVHSVFLAHNQKVTLISHTGSTVCMAGL